MRVFAACLFYFLHCIQSAAQSNAHYVQSNSAVQYGYAIKVSAEFGGKQNWLNWRAGFSAGAGAYLGKNWCYPTLHTEIMFYQGGIGSKWPGDKAASKKIDIEVNVAYTITAGFQNRMKQDHYLRPGIRNYPLYYFNTFTAQPLQNPYNWSASWGGNMIFFPTRSSDKFQQVGFLNIHLDRFQLSYINDGPPFRQPFGDRYDRFHTGGGFISFHGNDNWALNLIEVGYNKFTGYSKNAYELSNKLGSGYLYYHDTKQQYYNKSRFYFNLANTAKHYGVSVNLYNYPSLDVQHRIHLSAAYPLHMVPYPDYTSITGVFYYAESKTGLQ